MRDALEDGLKGGSPVSAVTLLALGLVLMVALLFFAGCGSESAAPVRAPSAAGVEQPPAAVLDVAETARQGEDLFNDNCSACHGAGAVGTSLGPPLIHRVYHPGHHPDFSFRNAVAQGVPQHHWPFGDMAPVPSVEEQEVEKIICYIRQTQRAEGLFEGDDFGTVC